MLKIFLAHRDIQTSNTQASRTETKQLESKHKENKTNAQILEIQMYTKIRNNVKKHVFKKELRPFRMGVYISACLR